MSIVGTTLMISAPWLLAYYYPYRKDKEIATETIKTYQEKGCHIAKDKDWSNCHRLLDKDGEEIYHGILIEHSSRLIAFYLDNRVEVIPTPENYTLKRARNPVE